MLPQHAPNSAYRDIDHVCKRIAVEPPDRDQPVAWECEAQWESGSDRDRQTSIPGAGMKVSGNSDKHETGRWQNNQAENSPPPIWRRERAMLRFCRMRSLQKFAAVHSSIHNHFNQERPLFSRDKFKLNHAADLAEWRGLGAGYGTAQLSLRRLVCIGLTAPPPT